MEIWFFRCFLGNSVSLTASIRHCSSYAHLWLRCGYSRAPEVSLPPAKGPLHPPGGHLKAIMCSAAAQIPFRWVLLPESELTVLKHSPEELRLGSIIGLDDYRDLFQPKGFCGLLAAFTSPQDQNCSSLLTKTSAGELCAGCKYPRYLHQWHFGIF